MTRPPCPQCGVLMVQRQARASGQPFWGCTRYPRCRGTLPVDEPASTGSELATLQATLRQVTRERDTLRAGYEQLLGEVRQLRRLARAATREQRPPPPPVATLVRELTRLLSVVHPDKWGGESAVATTLTQEVIRLRDRLQEGRL